MIEDWQKNHKILALRYAHPRDRLHETAVFLGEMRAAQAQRRATREQLRATPERLRDWLDRLAGSSWDL